MSEAYRQFLRQYVAETGQTYNQARSSDAFKGAWADQSNNESKETSSRKRRRQSTTTTTTTTKRPKPATSDNEHDTTFINVPKENRLSVVPKAVFEKMVAPYVQGETDCAVITSNGDACRRATIFRNGNGRTANCSYYCIQNMTQWLPHVLVELSRDLEGDSSMDFTTPEQTYAFTLQPPYVISEIKLITSGEEFGVGLTTNYRQAVAELYRKSQHLWQGLPGSLLLFPVMSLSITFTGQLESVPQYENDDDDEEEEETGTNFADFEDGTYKIQEDFLPSVLQRATINVENDWLYYSLGWAYTPSAKVHIVLPIAVSSVL